MPVDIPLHTVPHHSHALLPPIPTVCQIVEQQKSSISKQRKAEKKLIEFRAKIFDFIVEIDCFLGVSLKQWARL